MLFNNLSIQIGTIGILIMIISLVYFIILKNDLDKLSKISRDTRFDYKDKKFNLDCLTLFEFIYGMITIIYGFMVILAGDDFFYHSFLQFIIISIIGIIVIISFKVESK